MCLSGFVTLVIAWQIHVVPRASVFRLRCSCSLLTRVSFINIVCLQGLFLYLPFRFYGRLDAIRGTILTCFDYDSDKLFSLHLTISVKPIE